MTGVFDSYKDARVLVTGASGFLGARLCERLTAAGAVVAAVSRTARSERSGGPRWLTGDLSNADHASRLVEASSPDYVFHLASHVYGARDLALVAPTFRDNLTTTVNLLTALAERSCRRVVLAGSLEEPDPGEAFAVPSSPYAASKFAASAYGRFFHALYGTPVAIARIFMVYGPGQKDLDKLVPYVALSLLRGESPGLSGGTREVDWIYVDDVVEGLAAMALADASDGRTVDLGSGELTTVREVAETLAGIVGGPAEPTFGALADRAMEQVRVADVEATRERIGWSPGVSLREGLSRTVDWCRELRASGRAL